MSLRAYYAGEVAKGLLSSGEGDLPTLIMDDDKRMNFARSCLLFADSLIAALKEESK